MKELNLMPPNRVIASNQFDLLMPEIKGMFNSGMKDELEKYYSYAKARLDIIYHYLEIDIIRESENKV